MMEREKRVGWIDLSGEGAKSMYIPLTEREVPLIATKSPSVAEAAAAAPLWAVPSPIKYIERESP